MGIVIVTDMMQVAKPSQKATLGLRPEETRRLRSCEFKQYGLQRAEGAAGCVPLRIERKRVSLAGRRAECDEMRCHVAVRLLIRDEKKG
jgi:hypothetical protein